MATASFGVYVDWNGSGDPTDDARKNIATSVRSLVINRGKSGDFQQYGVGQAEITVSNPYAYYDPESPGIVESDGSVGGIRTTLANNQPVVDADRFFATPTAAGQAYAQSFSNAATRLVDRIDLRMKRTGSPGGTVTATLYTNSSNLPSAQKDNYSVSRAVTISTISTSYQWVMFTFERPVALLASTTYHIVVTTSGYTRSAGVNELSWGYNTTDYASGRPSTYNGTVWSGLTTTDDFKFRVTANDILPGRRVWIKATYGGTDYPLFYGRIKSVQPKPAADEQSAYILCEDLMAEFAEKDITLAMQTNRIIADQSAGSCVTDVLTDMGLTSTNWSVGDEDEKVPYAFYPRMNGLEALSALTEAAAGFHFMKPAPSGTWYKYIWRSRHYEYTATAVDSWDQTELRDEGVDHRMEHNDVYNRVIVAGNPRKAGAVGTLWEHGTTDEKWAASESRVMRAEFSSPAASVTTPVSGTDYPTGWTVSASSFATHTDLTVTAPASPSSGSVLTKLQIRGVPVDAQPQVSAIANDTESQAVYAALMGGDGILLGPTIDNDFIQSYPAAKRLADSMVDRCKRKFPDLVVTLSNRLGYPSILSVEVGDLVNVTTGAIGTSSRVNIGANGTYMIESIEHDVSSGGTIHFAKFRLRKAAVTSTRFFQYDVLGYDVGAMAP